MPNPPLGSLHENDKWRARHTRSLWESRRGELESGQPAPDYGVWLDDDPELWLLPEDGHEIDPELLAAQQDRIRAIMAQRGSGSWTGHDELTTWLLALAGLAAATLGTMLT